MRLFRSILLLTATLWLTGNADASAPAAPSQTETARWCSPELKQLTNTVCFFRPSASTNASKTLVIFLHGLTSSAPRAAWPQQERMAQMARTYGFSALIPRGRPGLGPRRSASELGWPTAPELQEQFEAELLGEWKAALGATQKNQGRPERTLLFGFSNGAYYASNLAFRSAFQAVFQVDGVAAFAGGSGSKYQRLLAARSKHRVPVFVGYGTQDPDHRRQAEMAKMLRQLGWPHRKLAARIGHTVAGSQLRAALRFLGHPLPSPP